MAFDENKYKKIFDERYGAGSFDAGLATARSIGESQAKAAFAKQEYNKRMKELEKAQKEALKKEKKKTYDDALEYWNNPEIKSAARKDGAYRNAENIRNDPRLKAQIKEMGYNVNDFIDAMFNATSDGFFRSEREAKKHTEDVKRQANRKPTTEELISQYSQNETKKETQKKESKKSDDRNAITKLKDFFSGKDVDGDGKRDGLLGFVDRFIVPVSKGATDAIFPKNTELMAENQKKKYGEVVNPVIAAAQEDRGLETKALNILGELGAFAAPYSKGYKAAELAVNKIPKLANIANPYARKAITGAIAGGAAEGGISAANELANPEANDLKDHLLRTGLGIAGGAVLDPALFGLGRLARKGFERAIPGDFPKFDGEVSPELLDRLSPLRRSSLFSTEHPTANSLLPDSYTMPDGNNVRMNSSDIANEIAKTQASLKEVIPSVNEYKKEFEQAVQQQYEYLKSSMGKGTTPGGLTYDREGYVTGAFGRVSNNPKWYQDFYAVHNRRPTNAELRELAEIQVREGFEDEIGSLPPWRPKAVQEIDGQMEELTMMVRQDPAQEPALRPIINALEEDKSSIMASIDDSLGQYETLKSRFDILKRAEKNQPQEFEAIRQAAATSESVKPPALKSSGKDFEAITAFSEDAPMKVAKPIDRTPIDIDNPKEIVKRQINKDGKKEKNKWSFEKFYTQWVEDLYPLEKAAKQLGGKNLEFDKNPYKKARLARGVAGKAETYLRSGVYSEDGKKIGNSLQEIIKPIEKKMDDFLAYSTAKRALDYDEKGLVAGIKPKDVEGMSDRQLADAAIRQIESESPEIKAAHAELIKYNNRLMDNLAEAGVLDKESVKSLRDENPNYIPMFRVQDEKVRGFQPLTNPKKTYANLGEPFKKRTGSEREIINPIESIVKNTYLTLNMAERNKVGRSLLELVEQSGDNAWGRVAKNGEGLSVDDVGKALGDASAEITEGKAEAIDKLFTGEGNKVYVYRDGKKVEMELQEDLYKSMLSLDTQQQHLFLKVLGVPTRMLRTGAVLSPDFGPVNIFRDQLAALVNSRYGFIPFVDMAKGMKHVVSKDKVYQQWKNAGGANSVLSTLDREYLQQDLRKMIKQSLGQKVKEGVKSPIHTVLEPLRKLSEMTEEATRVGVFEKALKKGASPQEAAFESRDIIDFNRAGSLGRQYNQMTAFFNAAIQSVDKMVRTFKDNPKGAMIRATTGITMPSVALYFMNHDQEWYKEIPQRERDLFWHFKVDDQIYKLPKPFEIGVIFGTSYERLLSYMETKDPKAFKDFGDTVLDATTPSFIPTALAPWIEVYANKSMYFKSPIVPRREQDLLPEDQYGPYQSELAKGLGKLTKQSPRNLEHVFKGYTGGLGKYALFGTDAIAEGFGVNKPALPDRGVADMPILNRFVVKNLEGNSQSVNDFYERMDKLRRENLSAKKNNPEHENTEAYKAMNKLSKDINELQAYKRAIVADPNMTGKQKADIIKNIDVAIMKIAQQGKQLAE
ncbi:hypothetical protein KHA93_11580 [Bacillus sp. FJAT-49732]|uniref:Large polyvalent protein associated domain-containing protein n=1 Tax=Lederbergia citrisecunda TaxID=2833583 RepID=A0A942YNG4_9BACI|nr:LPD38 domain-containing protein [Lederbergia citrisecunda]MBS4200271.1 hypothetical protein [Lederbergia citrisecunda]